MSLLSRYKSLQEPSHHQSVSYGGNSWYWDADKQNWYHNVENPAYWNYNDPKAEKYFSVYANGEKKQLWQQYEREQRPTMCAAMFWMTMITSLLVVGVLSAYIASYIPTTAETILMWLPVVSAPYLTLRYLRTHYRLDTNID